jgi:TonB family protein
MNDMNTKSSAIFTPSGCLTGDALMLLISGSLKGKDLINAQNHIIECPLCADAAEGLEMWLTETKTGQADLSISVYETHSENAELEGKRLSSSPHTKKSNGFTKSLFHARTDVISNRIKQRLYAHARLEAAEKKRLSYKPFVWLSAAATLLLFVTVGYVIWLQNQLERELDKERADQLALLQSPANPDTLIISLPENNAVPALNYIINPVESEFSKSSQGVAVTEKSAKPDAISDAQMADMAEAKEMLPENENVQYSDSIRTINPAEPVGISGVEVKAMGLIDAKKSGGNAVTGERPLPETVSVSVTKSKRNARNDTDYEDMVLTGVEQMPSYPGGADKMHKFLAENISYPQQAVESGIQGTVYVSFVVRKNGKLDEIKILSGIGGGCDEEASRIVKLMPRWTPGKKDGKLVDVLYTMPIVFRLTN